MVFTSSRNSHLLTIAIPTYNRSGLLMETLDSIKRQIIADKLQNDIALHINDNCSPDKTEEDVKHFIDSNPTIKTTYARNKENFGFDRNVDLAVRASNTPWTWLMGDDDLFVEGALKFMAEKIRSLPDGISFATMLVNGYDVDLKKQLTETSGEYPTDSVFSGGSAESARLYTKFGFIGNHVFRSEKWAATKNLEKFIGSHWIHLYFIFHWIGQGEKIAFFNRVCIKARYQTMYGVSNPSKREDANFEILYGAAEFIPQMIYETFQNTDEQRAITDAFFFPFLLLSFKKAEKTSLLPSKRDFELYNAAMKHQHSPKAKIYYTLELFTPPDVARLFRMMYDNYRAFSHTGRKTAQPAAITA